MSEVVRPASLPEAPGFSWAVKSHGHTFTSGIVAINEKMELVSDDPAVQAEVCLRRLIDTVEAAGGSLRNIVKMTCYATSEAAAKAYMRKKSEIFGGHAPAATVVVVSQLMMPGAQLEIEAVAAA